MGPRWRYLFQEPADSVLVTLESLVTETGVLELRFVARHDRLWKLELNVPSKSRRAA